MSDLLTLKEARRWLKTESAATVHGDACSTILALAEALREHGFDQQDGYGLCFCEWSSGPNDHTPACRKSNALLQQLGE